MADFPMPSPSPPWLERLVNTAFFSVCRTHGGAARSECNMYCLDCNVSAFCFYCRSSKHEDHRVIQIRRSSYHDVVRVSEMQKVLDISGVQTYVINSARVLFLKERPQPNINRGKSGDVSVSAHHRRRDRVCRVCGRSLLDTFRFCSLGCKLVGIKSNGDARFSLQANKEEATRTSDEGISSSRRVVNISSSRKQLHHHHQELLHCPSVRKRKGIPQRASF